MPVIYKDGIRYGGFVPSDQLSIELTQTQYDALTPAEKNNGAIYYVKDNNSNTPYEALINTIYPVGSVYISSTNTNPQNYFGGTWELNDKGYAYAWQTTGCTFDTTNTTDGAFACIRHGNSMTFRFTWKNAVAASDTTITIATIQADDIGYNGESESQMTAAYLGANADGLQAVGLARLSWANGVGTLVVDDWVTQTTSYPSTLNQTIQLYINYTVRQPEVMLDNFCDKFYWKRIA